MTSGLWKCSKAGEAVVIALEVGVPGALELAAIQADLDVEREPCLEPRMDEAENGMEEVVVNVQTLAGAQPQSTLPGIGGAVILKTHTGFDGPKCTDEPLLDRMALQQVLRQCFFVRAGRWQIANRTIPLLRAPQRGLRHALAGGEYVLLEVEQPHSGAVQEGMHAPLDAQGQQRPAEHQAVEPGQGGSDGGAITCYEGFHDGVLLIRRVFGDSHVHRGVAPVLLVGLRASARAKRGRSTISVEGPG